MSERATQNIIRNYLAGKVLCFRANVGQAWTGSSFHRLPNGDLLIKDPRPFSTGLPPGFSDLFGMVAKTITPEMVGRKVATFFAGEVKDEGGRVSEKQAAFLQAVKAHGGLAGVWRSTDDAQRTLGIGECDGRSTSENPASAG